MPLTWLTGGTQVFAVLSGDWATPVNTLLLVVLGLITLARERTARREREFVAKKVTNIEDKVSTDEPREVHTRAGDPPPWQQH
jgi:hypothetical protein